MKKALALILALVMLVALIGCSGTKTETATETKPAAQASDGKTITLSNGKSYPNGTVTFIAPFSAGGAVDLGLRLFTKYAAK